MVVPAIKMHGEIRPLTVTSCFYNRRRLYLQNVSTRERPLASMALLSEVKIWETLDGRCIDSTGNNGDVNKNKFQLQRYGILSGTHIWDKLGKPMINIGSGKEYQQQPCRI